MKNFLKYLKYFLLGRMHSTSDKDYKNFLVYAPMHSSLFFDSNKKVTDWISTETLSGTIKPFDTGLEPTMPNLTNGRVNLKFNSSVLVENAFLHCIVTFI